MRKIIVADTKKKLAESARFFKDSKYVAVDTETNSKEPFTGRLWSIQISDGRTHVFIPYNITSTIGPFKPILEDESRVIVMHNAKFDLRWLHIAAGVRIANAVCTQVTEFLLTAGLLMPCSLDHTLRRRIGVEISKDVRTDFYDGTFESENEISPRKAWTRERIEYAMGDVFDLVSLFKIQLKEIRRRGLRDTFDLEMDLLPVLCKLENIGVRLDAEECKKFHEDMKKKSEALYEEIERTLGKAWEKAWRREYAQATAKYDLWAQEHSEIIRRTNKLRDPNNRKKIAAEAMSERERHEALRPYPNRPKEKGRINLRAPDQVKRAFAELGLVLPNTKKELLEVLREEHPVLGLLLDYKKFIKLAEFGELYEKINPVTGQIHTDMNQVVSTGRLSSRTPNLQNITARSEEGKYFRSLFRARKGRKFVGADFAGIELVIIGKLFDNKKLLHAINNDYDIHCWTMQDFIGCPYKVLVRAKKGEELGKIEREAIAASRKIFERDFKLPDLLEIKEPGKWVKHLRDAYLKHVSYGLAYGLSPFGLARKFRTTKEVGELFQRRFYDKSYPGLESAFEGARERAFRLGYSETILGRKRFTRKPKTKDRDAIKKEILAKFKKEKRNLDSVTPREWESLIDEGMERARKEYRTQVNAIKRELGNMPIQGTSADITKLAMVLVNEKLEDAGFPETEGIVLTIHDELWIECAAKRAKLAAKILKEGMEEAFHFFLGDIFINVEPEIVDYWRK